MITFSRACIVVLLVLSPFKAQQQPQLWGKLQKGSFPVGFTVLNRRDGSRNDSAGVGRPIQISVWYPATNARSGVAMHFNDYYLLTAAQRTLVEPDSAAKSAATRAFSEFLVRAGSSQDAANQWLASPVVARRNAARAHGTFPVVLLGQGSFESAYSQAILAEYLASHGFVVATSPAPLLLEPENYPRKSVLDLARIQARDLSFALKETASAGFGDSTRTAIVAHSFGARSAFLLMTTHRIDGLVSLDGGIANRQGRESLDSTHIDLARLTSPVLHFYQDVDSTVTPDFSLLERLTAADRSLVRVDSLYHIDFTSVGFARAAFPGLAVAPPTSAIDAKVAAVAEMTLHFLQQVTSGDSAPSRTLFDTPVGSRSKYFRVRAIRRSH